MDIKWRKSTNKWIVEVWNDDPDFAPSLTGFDEPYPEEVYAEINQWCLNTLGYHTRTAYHIFEFKKRSELDWFLLRWQ